MRLRYRAVIAALASLELAPGGAHAQGSAAIYCSPTALSRCFSVRTEQGPNSGSSMQGAVFIRNLEGSYAHASYGGAAGLTAIDYAALSHYNAFSLGYGLGMNGVLKTQGTIVHNLTGYVDYVSSTDDVPYPSSTARIGIRNEGTGGGPMLYGCTTPPIGLIYSWNYSTCLRDGIVGELGFSVSAFRATYTVLPNGFVSPYQSPFVPADWSDFLLRVGDCVVYTGATSGYAASSGPVPGACVNTGDFVSASGSLIINPEPSTLVLLLGGVGALGAVARRRSRHVVRDRR